MAVGVFVWTATILGIFYGTEAQNSETIRLSLSGIDYANNSVITITDIGTDHLHPLTEGLQCITDHRPCCRHFPPGTTRSISQGEWYYPNGTHVLAYNEHSDDFYRTRGLNDGTVNLFRRNSGIMNPIGLFCCEIPDTSNVNQTLCVNIVPEVFVTIHNGGITPRLGQSYYLTCVVTRGIDVNAYQWRKDGAVLGGETLSVLSFPSLQLPDRGRYTCEVNVTVDSESTSITSDQDHIIAIQIPRPASVSITSNIASTVTIGSDVTVTCTVELSPTVVESDLTLLAVDTQLFRDGNAQTLTGLTRTGTTFKYTIRLDSFDRSDSGNYTCTATVSPQPTSTYLNASGNGVQSATAVIIAGSPPPLNVVASQASPSDPVEVSWSPPSGGATAITGYTIFYGNENSGSLPSVTTSIGLMLNGDYVGQTVSVCTEAEQLASQCANTSIFDSVEGNAEDFYSCKLEIGISTGVNVILICTVIALVVVIVLLKRKKVTTKFNGKFAVSANVAYGEVKLEPGAVYEDPHKVARSIEGDFEHAAAQCEFSVGPPAATVHGRSA